MDIVELNCKQYQDYELVFEYDANEAYGVAVLRDGKDFTVTLRRRALSAPVHRRFAENLFQRYLARPSAFAILADGVPAAVIQVDREFWCKRLRIADLVVSPEFRRRGYGAALLNHVLRLGRQEGFRAVYLDTQCCNVPAIDFYLSQGFALGGLDTTYYSNRDVERGEMYLEMVYAFDDEQSMTWSYWDE
jgi:ribosomal protein S18 acetylase RimI-like enzyme